jgi:hypothetical protein
MIDAAIWIAQSKTHMTENKNASVFPGLSQSVPDFKAKKVVVNETP